MQKKFVKYSLTFLFLLVYINRGIFVFPYEAENNGSKEINTVIELLTQLITGESNNIDEDGDGQTDCNSVKIVQRDFSQQMANYFELANLFSKKLAPNTFPSEESIPQKEFYFQIDHPPQKIS